VATDDERIKKSVQDIGGKAIMTSPYHHSGTDRVGEAAEKLSLKDEDVVLNLQGDEPCIDNKSVEAMLEEISSSSEIHMITLAFPSQNEEDYNNPDVVKVVVDKEGFALYFSRASIPYYRKKREKVEFLKHLGIYAYRKGFLTLLGNLPVSELEEKEKLEQLRVLENGYRIKVVFSSRDSIGVDTLEDLERLKKHLVKQG